MNKSEYEKQREILTELQKTLSPFLQKHSEKVSEYSTLLARAAYEAGIYKDNPSFNLAFVENIGEAAYWHDIGKAAISNDLWGLERPLTAKEYALAKSHPVLGVSKIVEKIESTHSSINSDDFFELTRDCCLYHHERWDGKGYPCGCVGIEIPISGRIVAIADSYDCMTADRPYMSKKSPEEALREIWRCAGTQFDPLLADVFVKMMGMYTTGKYECPKALYLDKLYRE